MRGVAALSVLLLHISPSSAQSGYLAVDFFFLLSGLVIANAYTGKLQAGMTVTQFFKVRLVRLYPLLGAGLAIGLAARSVRHFDPSTHSDLAISAVLNFLLLPSPWTTGYVFPLNPPVWSLFLELVVNVAFAAVLVRAPIRYLRVLVTGAGLALVWIAASAGSLEVGAFWDSFGGGLVRTIFSFFLGVLLARVHTLPGRSSWLSPMLALIVGALMFVPVHGPFRIAFDLLFVLVLSPSLVWAGSRCQPPAGLRRLSVFLGDLSYPLYAVHFPIIWVAVGLARRTAAPPELWQPLCVGCVIAAAWALGKFFDEPARRRLGAWTAPRPGSTTRPSQRRPVSAPTVEPP